MTFRNYFIKLLLSFKIYLYLFPIPVSFFLPLVIFSYQMSKWMSTEHLLILCLFVFYLLRYAFGALSYLIVISNIRPALYFWNWLANVFCVQDFCLYSWKVGLSLSCLVIILPDFNIRSFWLLIHVRNYLQFFLFSEKSSC